MACKNNAVIVGGGYSKFGIRQATLLDMIQEAARAAADDIPGLQPADIDGLIVATTMAGRHSNALNTAPLVVHRLGLKPTSICVRVDSPFFPLAPEDLCLAIKVVKMGFILFFHHKNLPLNTLLHPTSLLRTDGLISPSFLPQADVLSRYFSTNEIPFASMINIFGIASCPSFLQ